MKLLSDYSLDELYKELDFLPKFRAKQIFDAILQAKDFDKVALPKEVKEKLSKEYILNPIKSYQVFVSKDGTKKYLLKFYDGAVVEGVKLFQEYGKTFCISTQVGCRMGCKFCASTSNGLFRNLSAGEILSSVATINADEEDCTKRNFTNIVLMGSGEPFDNYDNVVKFLYLLTDKSGFNLSERNISLSTCGLVDKIYDFMKLNFNVTLCISLHATADEMRKKIMPIANRYSISEIVKALKDYTKYTKRRAIIEYCLVKGVNDSFKDADRLIQLFKGMLIHINVICLNPKDDNLKATTKHDAYAFIKRLNDGGLSATLRRSQGEDIGGACGQLKARYETDLN